MTVSINILPAGMVSERWVEELEQTTDIDIVNFVEDKEDADVILLRWSRFGTADEVMQGLMAEQEYDVPIVVLQSGRSVPYWLREVTDVVKQGTTTAVHAALTIDIDNVPDDPEEMV